MLAHMALFLVTCPAVTFKFDAVEYIDIGLPLAAEKPMCRLCPLTTCK